MRVAIIVGGIVENVIELPGAVIAGGGGSATIADAPRTVIAGGTADVETYTAVFSPPPGGILVASDTAGAGWHYDGANFTAP